jgi:ABC-type sugar transport system substrate-binding protein
MEYRPLGCTGVSVSKLCLGTMMFGDWGTKDHDESIAIIRRALDAGINFVDTADVYSQGESEVIVGKALAGRRDDVVLATKFFMPFDDDPNHRGGSRRWIMQEVEIDVVSTSYTQQGGYQGARQLLARSRRPTAIFAGADIVAMGVLEAIAEAGLAGPISLTSVEQGGRQIGANAARLLLERIADRHKPTAHVKLTPTLVPRRTTAPPP